MNARPVVRPTAAAMTKIGTTIARPPSLKSSKKKGTVHSPKKKMTNTETPLPTAARIRSVGLNQAAADGP